jgi:uncharacterized protein (DUF2336 family)
MTTQPSLLGDLESAIQSGSGERRTAVLRQITDLFVAAAPRITDAQAGLFDDVFEQLTHEIEHKALIELSDRMAAADRTPGRLLLRLAHDDSIEVSGPVLARSSGLADDDLLAIARTKSQAHLAAIAGRAEIGEQVTSVLVERGDAAVARKVAQNAGARFTAFALKTLVDRAGEDGDLADAVARRRELPPAMFRDLVARATETVRNRLLESARPGTAQAINKILTEVSQSVEAATAPKRSYQAAQRRVLDMQKQAGAAPPALLQFAKTLQIEEMVVTLSLLTGVSIEVIDRFMDESSDDPILILGKAIDLDWTTVAAMLAARLGTPQLRDARADEANRKYRKLTTYSAQRVLRFWQAREKLAQAG